MVSRHFGGLGLFRGMGRGAKTVTARSSTKVEPMNRPYMVANNSISTVRIPTCQCRVQNGWPNAPGPGLGLAPCLGPNPETNNLKVTMTPLPMRWTAGTRYVNMVFVVLYHVLLELRLSVGHRRTQVVAGWSCTISRFSCH